MSDYLLSKNIECPYCGEAIDIYIDDCGENQEYIEDCQVCCRPITFKINVDENEKVELNVFAENE